MKKKDGQSFDPGKFHKDFEPHEERVVSKDTIENLGYKPKKEMTGVELLVSAKHRHLLKVRREMEKDGR